MKITNYLRKSLIFLVAAYTGMLPFNSYATNSNLDTTQSYDFTEPSSLPQDCSQSLNPSACELQLPVNDDALSPYTLALAGMNNVVNGLAGPVSAGVKYDADLSWIGTLGYTKMFDKNFGISTKFAGGENEWRANVTAGLSIYSNQEVKITYEYLNQNQKYDFDSGDVRERIGQNGVGAAYTYVRPHSVLHAVELSGNWAQAGNKDLDSEVIYKDDIPYSDDRHIAGGEEGTSLATLRFLPFSRSLFSVGAGYSEVGYDTKFDGDDSDKSTVAYNVDLSTLPTLTTKFSADVNNTASSREADLKLSQIVPHNLELAVWGLYSHGYNALKDSHSVMLSLNYPVPPKYSFEETDQLTRLYDWVNKPVIYYQRVLAIAEEEVKQIEIESQQLANQTVAVGQSIVPVTSEEAFDFNTNQFNSVTYTLDVTKSGDGNKNFADDLNLTITQDDKFSAEVFSESPIPTNNGGTYTVTVKATGNRSGLKEPIVQTSSFKLTVADAPTWNHSTLPAAILGQPYPCVNISDYASIPGVNTAILYALVSNQPWLQVTTQCLQSHSASQHLQGNNQTQYFLVAAGDHQNQPVPTGANTNVTLSATAKVDGSTLTSKQKFRLTINQIPPEWTSIPSFGTVTVPTDVNEKLPVDHPLALNQFVKENTSQGLKIVIDPNAKDGKNFVPANWKIVKSNGQFYLERAANTITSGEETGVVSKIAVLATNSTSTSEVPQTISLTLAIPEVPPSWSTIPNFNTVTLPIDVNQNLPIVGALALNNYVTAGAPGLNITIDPNASHGTNFVPANWTVVKSNNQFFLQRTASSLSSGETTGSAAVSVIATNSAFPNDPVPQQINLTLAISPPIWTAIPNFGNVKLSTQTGNPLPIGNPLALDQFIVPGTGDGLQIKIDPNASDGTHFVPANWIVIKKSNGFFLERITNTFTAGEVKSPNITEVAVIASNSENPGVEVPQTIAITMSP